MQQWVSAVKSFVNIYYHSSALHPAVISLHRTSSNGNDYLEIIDTSNYHGAVAGKNPLGASPSASPVEHESNMPHVSFNSK